MADPGKVLKRLERQRNRINRDVNPDRGAPKRRKAKAAAKAKAKRAPRKGFVLRHALKIARRIRGVP